MNKKQFDKYIKRDEGICCHCGTDDDTLVPNHRLNRGSGGSKERDVPSNIILICSRANGQLESNATFAQMGRDFGWKLTSGQDPKKTPVWLADGWYLLDDEFGKVRVKHPTEYDSDYN
jgi:hypothetical protein